MKIVDGPKVDRERYMNSKEYLELEKAIAHNIELEKKVMSGELSLKEANEMSLTMDITIPKDCFEQPIDPVPKPIENATVLINVYRYERGMNLNELLKILTELKNLDPKSGEKIIVFDEDRMNGDLDCKKIREVIAGKKYVHLY